MEGRFRVTPVWTYVDGDSELFSVIDDVLTIEVPNAKYSKLYRDGLWDGKKRFFDKVRNRFLTGFLDMVRERVEEEGGEVEVVGEEDSKYVFEVREEEIKLNGIDWERFKKVQLPLLRAIGERGRCAVRLATGGGKTEVIAGLCSVLRDKRCLVLVHRIELLEQTRRKLEERLEERVGVLESGRVDIGKRVVVGMVWSAVSKIHRVYSWLQNDVDVLVVDEVHHSGADTWKKIMMNCNARVRVGLSGTPLTRDVERDMWLIGLTGEVVEGARISDLVEMGYAVRPVVYVVVDDRLVFGDWKRKWGKKYWDVVRQVYSDVRFLEVVGEIVMRHGKSGLVVFVDRVEVGEKILTWLRRVLGERRCEFSHGKLEDYKRIQILRALREGAIDVLVCTPILDEGVDVEGITGILFACSNKSIVKILQRIGRGVRLGKGKDEVRVYDMNVVAPWLFQHLQERLKLYKEEGFEVKLVRIGGGEYGFEEIA